MIDLSGFSAFNAALEKAGMAFQQFAEGLKVLGKAWEEILNQSPCCPGERTTVFQVGGLRLPWKERKEVRLCNGCGRELPLFLLDMVVLR